MTIYTDKVLKHRWLMGSRDGAVVRALASSHQCVPGSILRPGVICEPFVGWVCCWFSSLVREVFLRVLRFSPLLKNQHFQIPIRSGIVKHFIMSLWLGWLRKHSLCLTLNLHLHFTFLQTTNTFWTPSRQRNIMIPTAYHAKNIATPLPLLSLSPSLHAPHFDNLGNGTHYHSFTFNARNKLLRTFALIVSAHPYCARKFTCHVIHRVRVLSTKMNNDRADGHCYGFAWI